MNSTWSISAGWALMMAVVLLLAALHRLDLLLIVVPLAALFGYRLRRVRSGVPAERR
jgi:hypothetical protein